VTRITYGPAWIQPDGHTTNWDEVSAVVTWDGACELDSAGNSAATLSNGWKPFFQGKTACTIALDVRGSCKPNDGCATRVSYGSTWDAPADHPNHYDDVDGRVTSDGVCMTSDQSSYVTLSNGWEPHFRGANSCELALRYTQCGGL
jgi:hypothetical protein